MPLGFTALLDEHGHIVVSDFFFTISDHDNDQIEEIYKALNELYGEKIVKAIKTHMSDKGKVILFSFNNI